MRARPVVSARYTFLIVTLITAAGCSRGPASPTAASGPGAPLPPGAYVLRVSTSTEAVGLPPPSFGQTGVILCMSVGAAPPGHAVVPVRAAVAAEGWSITTEDGRLTFLLKREETNASAVVTGIVGAVDGSTVRFGGTQGPAVLVGRLGTGSVSGPVEGPVTFVSPAGGSLSCHANWFSLTPR
jgi:hypothetical protein